MRRPTLEQLEQFEEVFHRVAKRRGWDEAQRLQFLQLLRFKKLWAPPPVEGGSPNFVQVSGPGGRVQTMNATAGPNTFIWNPQSLKGQDAGGDFMYARRIKFRSVIALLNITGGSLVPPTAEQIAQALGNVRVFSQFLGEMVPKNLNSVPLLLNHDQYFVNGFRPITRRRPVSGTLGTESTNYFEVIFEIPFERDYLLRSMDSCPWLPFLEGAILEVDIAPLTSLLEWGYQVGSVTQTCTIDYYLDKQALIHSPIQSRLYRVTTTGPEFVLKSVGSPQGLDGVTSGSRLAVLSWLAAGYDTTHVSATGSSHDNGFYAAFGGSGGQNFGTNGLNRLDVPFRGQVSIDDVSAWLEAFLSDCNPIRMFQNLVPSPGVIMGDITQFPFVDSISNTNAIAVTGSMGPTTSLISDALDFFPLIWPQPGDKISDFQKVNGDLSFTATQPSPPGASILNLFRTDEVCGFTPDKVMDLMARMGLPHKQRGGSYLYVPKYAGAKKADDTTIWGFPLKIIKA
jgi:hypothetical protein